MRDIELVSKTNPSTANRNIVVMKAYLGNGLRIGTRSNVADKARSVASTTKNPLRSLVIMSGFKETTRYVVEEGS